MTSPTPQFADLVEMIDRLSLDDQEALADLVRRRTAEQRRAQVVKDVRDARRQFRQGKSERTTVDDLMREIAG